VGATPTRNSSSDALTFSYTDGAGAHHDVWYTDATTETDRIKLAHTSGFGGSGVWRLGHEDQRLWSDPLFTGTW
jgi:spore germination protein YaaH